ncbi:helix-turn-helix transcriptional regulator [Rhodoglobus vestalii]|nr:AraC family transcriptional regulator [Rhodoglobus vestalii]
MNVNADEKMASFGLSLSQTVASVATRLNSRHHGVVVCAQDGQLLFVNDQVAAMVEAKGSYLPPSHWTSHYGLGSPQGNYRDIREAPVLAALEQGSIESVVMRTRSGSETQLLRVWAQAITGDHGDVLGSIAVLYPHNQSSRIHAPAMGARVAVQNSHDSTLTSAILHAAEDYAEIVLDRFMSASPVQQVHALIRHRFSEPWTLKTIADTVSFDPGYLTTLYGSQTGTTVMADLTRVRMDHAHNLIENTTLTVSEVAFRVGLVDLSHFSRTFRHAFGYSPRVLRSHKER